MGPRHGADVRRRDHRLHACRAGGRGPCRPASGRMRPGPAAGRRHQPVGSRATLSGDTSLSMLAPEVSSRTCPMSWSVLSVY